MLHVLEKGYERFKFKTLSAILNVQGPQKKNVNTF